MLFKPKVDERVILDLLENYLQLNQNPKVFIETARIYRERGKEKIAEILEAVVDDIRAGIKVVEALNNYGLLKPDTYLFLSTLQESSMLIPSLVRDVKERTEFLKQTEKEIKMAMISPFITIIVLVMAGIVLEKKLFLDIAKQVGVKIEGYTLQKLLATHPFISAPIYILVLMFLTYFIAKLVIKYQIETPKKLFEVSSLAKVLTNAKQPLRKIFSILADREPSKKWRRIFIQIAEAYGESFQNQIKPLVKFLNELVAVRFLLIAERSQAQAWDYLKQYSQEITKDKVEVVKQNFGFITQMLTWIVLGFLALPFKEIFMGIMQKLSF